MFYNKTKSEIDNFYDLLSARSGIMPINNLRVDVATTSSAVTPAAGTFNKNSKVTVTGKTGTPFEQLGSADVYYDRAALDQYVGLHGGKIFVTNADTHETIVQKICDRLKIARSWVTYTAPARLPTGLGLDPQIYALSLAVSSTSNKIFNSAAVVNITAINNNPLALPLQPTLYFGDDNGSGNITVGGVSTSFTRYETYAKYAAGLIFDITIHGDETRSVNDCFIQWLNNYIAPAAKPFVKFTPQNTEVRGVAASASAHLPYVALRGKTADSPITQTLGIALRPRAKEVRNAGYVVPAWVTAVETLEQAREPIRKFLRVPRDQFTLTSFSKNASTGVITASLTNNIVCPAFPVLGNVNFALNPSS